MTRFLGLVVVALLYADVAPAQERVQIDGSYFVKANNGRATIRQGRGGLTLTNEKGTTTQGTWLNARQFRAWDQTATVVQEGAVTRILWERDRAFTWERAQIDGSYFVRANNGRATIRQAGDGLTLTNEHGNSTPGTWLNATQFRAWDQTATIVAEGPLTRIQWERDRAFTWERAQIDGTYIVQNPRGGTRRLATVRQSGDSLTLTNETGEVTQGYWINATQFTAWGQTAQVVRQRGRTQILWDGNAWELAQAP